MKNKMKVAVIGAGASGIVAAITAVKYGAEVTLFEKMTEWGRRFFPQGTENAIWGTWNFPWSSIIVMTEKS